MKSVTLDQKLKEKQEELKHQEQELSDQHEVGVCRGNLQPL